MAWKANIVSIEKSQTPECIDITVHYTDGLSSMDQVVTVSENMPRMSVEYMISARTAALEKMVAVENDLAPLMDVVWEGVPTPKVFTK